MASSSPRRASGRPLARDPEMLSASQMVDQTTDAQFPGLPAIGPKLSFLHPEKQEDLVRERLGPLGALLSEARLCHCHQVSEAAWDESAKVARLKKQSGRHWEIMGHIDKAIDPESLLLWPEEALFLLETNRLRLCFGGLEASVQQAYARLLRPDLCSAVQYRVYSYLSRLGFKVVRHQGHLGFTAYEGKIGLDRHKEDKRTARKRKQDRKCQSVKASSDEEDLTEVTDVSVVKAEAAQCQEGPLKTLWSGRTKPLLHPAQATCPEAIMKAITLPQAPGPRHKSHNPYVISFDVYAPHVTFCKSAPRLPNYRIVALSSEEEIPTQESINSLNKLLRDGVPLLFSVDNVGAIAFYCFSRVSLPTEVTVDSSAVQRSSL